MSSSRSHDPHCLGDHELEPADGSEPEPCPLGTAVDVESGAVAARVSEPEPGIVLDARGVFIPRTRARDYWLRVQALLS